jgi:PAS domain S-box-containing protein
LLNTELQGLNRLYHREKIFSIGEFKIHATLQGTKKGIKKVLLEIETNQVPSLENLELVEQNSALKDLLEKIPDGGIIVDEFEKIISANLAAEKMMGFQPGSMIGKNFLDFVPDQDKDTILAGTAIRRKGSSGKYEIKLKTEGGERIIRMTATPRFDEEGVFIGSIGIFEDITEKITKERALEDSNNNLTELLKRLEEAMEELEQTVEELGKAKEKAEESDRLKSAFLQNISHEIRTPLNAIVGFSSFLNNPDFSREKREQFIEIIQKSSDQLLEIITNIVDISTIQAGQVTLSKDLIRIFPFVEKLINSYSTKKETLKLELKYEELIHLKEMDLNIDIARFQQIMKNLIENAIKFTDKGTISIGYEKIENQKDSFLQFYVKDNGSGIDEKKLKSIFESFDKTKLVGTSGTGLGLAISKALVELHGGQIWVKNNPDGEPGCTFYFTIPLEIV